jgi:hypothetical protein
MDDEASEREELDTIAVDETAMKPEGRKPLLERHRKKAIAKQGQ